MWDFVVHFADGSNFVTSEAGTQSEIINRYYERRYRFAGQTIKVVCIQFLPQEVHGVQSVCVAA